MKNLYLKIQIHYNITKVDENKIIKLINNFSEK